MNQTARTPSEYSPHTTVFKSGEAARSATAAPCQVYQFEFYQSDEPAPPGSKSPSAIVERWNADPDKKAAMIAARERWAERLEVEASPTLKSMRLQRGLSQTSLAVILGTSQSHVARIESGSTQITLSTCRRLAEAFEVDLNAIDRAVPHDQTTEA